ncbi:unnamed protein product [Closterium sp. NIES-53]
MASLRVLAFDHEGRLVAFDTWHEDLQLYLLSDIKDSVSMFDHVSGVAPAPPATANGGTRSQWLSRDATARLAIRNHLPVAECTHFGQHRTAQALYDAVVARYSSPATAALNRLLLPYLFLELDQFLSLDPTSLTVDLLEQHRLAAETSAVAVGAARDTPRPPFFEGCSPSPLSPSTSAAAADVSVTKDVSAASTSAKRCSSKGKGGRGGGGGSGGGGGGSGGGGGGSGSGGGGSGGGGGGSGGGGGGGTGGGSGGSGGGDGGSGGSGSSGGSGTGGGSTSGLGLVLGGRRPVVLTGHADASWADDQATQRSSQGYTFSLGSGSVSWRATRSSSFLGSSCEAEIYAGAMAAQELRWLTYLVTDLGEPPRSPPVLYVDNKAMLALCREQRLEHRTKHIALRYFLARELQQRGQLRLAYVASEANTADVFTKALAPCNHQRFCTQLGLVPVLPHLLTS